MKQVNDVLSKLIDDNQPRLVVYSVGVPTGVGIATNTKRLYTRNTFYLCKTSTITILGVDYKIENFDINKYVDIIATVSIPTGSYLIRNPYFTTAKLVDAQTEIGNKQPIEIMPIIWQLDLTKRRYFSERSDNANESEGQIRLFVMGTNDPSMDTEQHYEEFIKPLDNYIDWLLQQANDTCSIGKITTANKINHAKFTVQSKFPTAQTQKRDEKDVLGFNLSGVELEIDFPIRKCNC